MLIRVVIYFFRSTNFLEAVRPECVLVRAKPLLRPNKALLRGIKGLEKVNLDDLFMARNFPLIES
jgi:hypothetical protein